MTRRGEVTWRHGHARGWFVTAAGVGWLYALRSAHVLGAGPHVAEALPLQRLAKDDDQPLLRLVAAWLPAGLVAGLAVQAAWPMARPIRALVVGVRGRVHRQRASRNHPAIGQ